MPAAEVGRLLPPAACIAAVEDAFGRLARGGVPAPGILAMHAEEGSFHVKAGLLTTDRAYFAAKVNANFPENGRHGLPTIQGAVILMDASNGAPLAMMDSMSITALRTAAATAVAAKHLAPQSCAVALICGCGAQAFEQVRALYAVRRPQRLLAYDRDPVRAAKFATDVRSRLGIAAEAESDLPEALGAARIVVTCTTARRFFVESRWVRPGTFIAAVGADNEDKQEIEPALMARAKVVTDLTAQAARIGDLHHAIAGGAMKVEAVHAELAEVVAGLKPGRTSEDEITVFDSTGTGLQDVAAAIAAYSAMRREGE